MEQWRQIERDLPEGWGDVRLLLTLPGESQAARAASLLGPINAGRSGREVRFFCARRGAGPRPDTLARLLRRVDEERIGGTLEVLAVAEPSAEPPPETRRRSLAEEWAAQLDALPPDWSDVYAEVELRSSDQLERAALLASPLNPARFGGMPAFRFRCARNFGYGAAAEMVRRCLERIDAEEIRGEVRILRALSDSRHVATQGPVWYVEGKSV